MLFVRIEDILYFSAEDKYVTIYSKEGKTYLCNLSLKSLEEKLEDKFLRIHRSLLINVSRIKEIDKYFGSRFIVKIDDAGQTKLTSGRNYYEQIKEIMEI